MIQRSDLGEELCAVGLLLGLLTPGADASTVVLNTDWFRDPVGNLERCGTHISNLIGLLSVVLLPADTPGPAVFPGACWFPVPQSGNGFATSFSIVAAPPSNTEGEVGLGFANAVQFGSVTATFFGYLPISAYGAGGAQRILGSVGHPCQIGLSAASSTPFTVAGGGTPVTFTAVDLVGKLYLDPAAYGNSSAGPFVTLTFEGLTGTQKPGVYTSLTSLLDSDVEAWLLEVIVQSGLWLESYLGNTTFTLGDVLEAAQLLRRDYHLQPANIADAADMASLLTNAMTDPVSAYVWSQISAAQKSALQQASPTPAQQASAVADALNTVATAPACVYDVTRFADVLLSPQASTLLSLQPQGDDLLRLNRLLLQDAFRPDIVPGAYELNLAHLQGSASDIALQVLFGAMRAMSIVDSPFLCLPGGGIYIAEHTRADGSQDYGLRLQFDLPLTDTRAQDGTSPAVDLCMGSWLTGENDTSNWMTLATGGTTLMDMPGASLFLLHRAGQTVSFAPGFELVSVGFNLRGAANKPLLNVGGYTLGGTDLRVYFSATPITPASGWQYGFSLRLDGLGFPVAPTLDQAGSSKSNPVASSMVASSGGGGDATPVNPTFSAKAGYMNTHPAFFELIGDPVGVDGTMWFPLHHRFGPVNCRKLGVEICSGPKLGLLFDASVTLSGLEVDLDQLTVGVDLKQPADLSSYNLDLQGISVSFHAADVGISGGLDKVVNGTSIAYNGDALIQYQDIVLAALGSYTSVASGGTSLFIFAVLYKTFGGPACFYVTGLAAGFGYNRSLALPDVVDVQSFPLVAGLSDPGVWGGSDPGARDVLAALDTWVPPTRGEYWVAAGVQFTTFKIIETNALLAVEFGNQLAISVLGVSTLKQPVDGDAYVYAELNIDVLILPSLGEIQASALLSPASYVFTEEAHLTGGFAFFAWFGSNGHAGDFVFTVGGYHPAFQPPSYYPQPPRLAINWQIDEGLAMLGDAYFTITPSAMMAGAAISVTYHNGNLNAWLNASIDVILYWSPFYLIGDASISVGVSYRMNLLFTHVTLSVEIGAQFHLWGPPVGGTVHIDWYIISFTIGFGADQRDTQDMPWDDFAKLLPTSTAPAALMAQYANPAAAAPGPAYLHIVANDGLNRNGKVNGVDVWLVRAARFRVSVGSAVPVWSGTQSTGFSMAHNADAPAMPAALPVSMRRVNGGVSATQYNCPMFAAVLKLKHGLTWTQTQACMADAATGSVYPSPANSAPAVMQGWLVTAMGKDMPQAMWGDTPAGGPGSGLNDAATVAATVGLMLQPEPPNFNNGSPAMTIDTVFKDRTVNPESENGLPLSQVAAPVTLPLGPAETFVDLAAVDSDPIASVRGNVLLVLQQMGYLPGAFDRLLKMQATPGKDFADDPMEGSVVAA